MPTLRTLCALGAAALLPMAGAHAASTWNFSSGCSQVNNSAANNYGNSYSCSGGTGAATATATAWSTTSTGSAFAIANLALYSGSGFGVRNQSEGLNTTSPNHSTDNSGTTDLVMLSFSSSIVLSEVSLGWMQTDSDISLLRYTGTTTPTMTGNTVASLLTSGWEIVGNYADVGTTSAATVNAAGVSSSWWLISAYNSGYGGNTSSALTNGNDYVKVLSVAGAAPDPVKGTPEPGSIALAALALGGVWVTRRKAGARA